MKNHQHKDKKGNVFGRSHLVNAVHSKKETQKAHDRTIEMDKGVAK